MSLCLFLLYLFISPFIFFLVSVSLSLCSVVTPCTLVSHVLFDYTANLTISKSNFFTRCIQCNSIVIFLPREDVKGQVPDGMYPYITSVCCLLPMTWEDIFLRINSTNVMHATKCIGMEHIRIYSKSNLMRRTVCIFILFFLFSLSHSYYFFFYSNCCRLDFM